MAKRMKRETLLRLQRLLTLVSFLVGVVATVIWYRYRAAGVPSPLWLLGVVGYCWTFVAFFSINTAARNSSRNLRDRS